MELNGAVELYSDPNCVPAKRWSFYSDPIYCVEEFLQNPSQPKGTRLPQNYDWVRTVSKEEAEASTDRIQKWVESGKSPKGGQLGEWIYGAKTTPGEFPKVTTKKSLTPGAFQRNWWVPTEFPLCPDGRGEDLDRTHAFKYRLHCIRPQCQISAARTVLLMPVDGP